MKWLNNDRTRLALLSVVAIMTVGSNSAKAEFIFGEPYKVPNVNSSSSESYLHISPDGLELYFVSNRPYGANACHNDIWVSRRSTLDETWNQPVKLDPPINTPGPDGSPCLSSDGLELYFTDCVIDFYEGGGCEPRPNGYGRGDIWVSKRASKEDPWSDPMNLGPIVNSEYNEGQPSISVDGLSLYFSSDRPGGIGETDLWMTQRSSINQPWGEPLNLGKPVNTGVWETAPHISPDGLSLFYSAGTYSTDIYVSKRTSSTAPWESPVRLPSINTNKSEYFLTFAEGDCALYFVRGDDIYLQHLPHSPAFATYDIWQIDVTPVVDLNSDGIVDAVDVTIMVDHWHTDNTLCDIAPAPFGDGFVDIQDLTVLANHLFEQVPSTE